MAPKAKPSKARRSASLRAKSSRSKTGGSGLSLKSLMSLPTYHEPTLSWQKDKMAFFFDGTGRLELYVSSIDRPRPRQLSHGEMPRSLRTTTLWDRNGENIFFGKDVGGNEQHDLYRIQVKDSKVSRLTNDPTSEKHAVDISPDGHWLLVLGNISGRGGRRQLNLWRLDLKSGGLEQLTDSPSPVGYSTPQFQYYSPDGKWIAYGTNETSSAKNSDVYRCRADGSEPELLFRGKEGSQDGPAAWSPDSRFLGITSDVSGTDRPGILDVASRSVRWMGQAGRDELTVEFSSDGRHLLTVSNSGVEVFPHLYDIASGEEIALDLPPGCYFPVQFGPNPLQIIIFYTDAGAPYQFWTYDVRTKSRKILIPPVTKGIDPKLLVGCETVRYSSFDGRKIEALLYRSKSQPGSGFSPGLVEVHGGPTGQFFREFSPIAQFLVNQGYNLLLPNIRGSTGYGSEFRDLNRKDWGGGDLEDVVKGAQLLASLPGADPKRIGIFGTSYGGYMTYIAVVKRPEVWKAGCAIVGITDLLGMYGKSKEHFRYFMRDQMGDPVKDAALWKDRSAVNFAQSMTAKLLMLHGVNDPRCPVDQARVFRDRLLELGRVPGKDFEYEEFGDEGHSTQDIRQKLSLYGRMTAFFHKELWSD